MFASHNIDFDLNCFGLSTLICFDFAFSHSVY